MFKKILEKLSGGNTLYFPGCLTHYVLPNIEENYKNILRKLNIDFIFLPDFNCCGSPVTHAGYKNDFEDLKKKNIEFFKKFGIKRIITNCPACFKILKENYPELKIEHIIQVLVKNLNKLKKSKEGEITYHDPCHLGRHSNIFDEPREILKHIGFKVVELSNNKEKSLCCGAGGGLKTNNPDLSNKIGKSVIDKCKTKYFVTPCPMCYKHFKDNSKNVKVLEFSEVIEC